MAQISKTGIESGSIIYPEHVLRTIEALRGEKGYDYILSGSLIISSSAIQIKSLIQNNAITSLIGYNTSSGDLYYTTGSYQGPAGPPGADSTVPGPSGSEGPPGPIGTGISAIISNPDGSITFILTDSSTYTTDIITGSAGPAGPQGPAGPPIIGGIDVTNPLIRYVAHTGSLSARVEILSSADTFTEKSWYRSGTTLSINSPTHSLSNGDYIVVRNANVDYIYTPITVTGGDDFTISVSNTGSLSGVSLAYTPAFRVTGFTPENLTLEAPSSGKAQLISLNVVTGIKSASTFLLTLPSSLNNGAGANDNLLDQNPPIFSAYRLSNGTVINTATLTLNTVSNFNEFNIGGLVTLINNLIRFTF